MAAVLAPRPEPAAPIAATLARFAAGTAPDAIPAAVRARARHLMLDAIGIGFASTTFDFAGAALAGAHALGGAGDSIVLGMGARLPLRDAVMMNGVLLHGLDYDDTHVPGVIHATVSLLPTVLGQGAARGRSGAEVLSAYIVGAEAATRVATAARGGFHKLGFHPTGLVGAFGCALAAGRLAGLTVDQLVMAQGIALSLAGGSLEFLEDGAWTKRLHPGWAGVAGITAATLAAHGFTGPAAAYEGRYGLFALHLDGGAAAAELPAATAGLGRDWEIHNIAVKPFPLCHLTHGCADAAIALHRAGVDPARIARVTALVPAETVQVVCEPVANKRRPQNDYDARFSIPFIVASGLIAGRVGLAELEAERLADPAVLALADRVEYRVDPAAEFPRYYSGEVIVELDDGRVLRHREHVNRGAAERPITEDEIVAKFIDNATLAIPHARALAVRDAVLGLDDVADVNTLARLLA
ncbi:MAG: MmgE/PrpD family protein [Burkholderiales bacterium]|nr:MmgE/PrpD family protein [Burkholderiales bacterium]